MRIWDFTYYKMKTDTNIIEYYDISANEALENAGYKLCPECSYPMYLFEKEYICKECGETITE